MKATAWWLLLSLPAQAGPGLLPDLILPQGVGVNIHFTTGHDTELDLIARGGFRWVRMDFGWAGTERRPGEYDWSAYEALTSALERRQLRAIYILDYSNPLYETTVVSKNPITGREQRATASPQHAESVAAFARWAAAAAAHFKGRPIVWEIWNEPNIFFWQPKPDVAQYCALALATCRAIRRADPEATIIGPATSEVPLPFLETFLASGVLPYLAGISVHPYRNYAKPPETADEDYVKLREFILRYAPAGRHVPIISGEWGYASHVKGVTLETQAAFLARQQLANLLAGIPLSIWYDWKNDGEDANEREHNFGTVMPDLRPKPAYLAVQTLTTELDGYRIKERVRQPNERDYVLRLSKPRSGDRLAAWTLDQPHEVSLPLRLKRAGKVAVVSGLGRRYQPLPSQPPAAANANPTPDPDAPFRVQGERLILRLGSLPLYVDLRDERSR
jgi:hypothetical protein